MSRRGWRAALATVALLGLACTSIHFEPVDAEQHRLERVCIERNPRVLVPALVPAIRDAFRRNGVPTELRVSKDVDSCRFVLRYTALRGWDIANYTRVIELELTRGDETIGSVDYEHHGGFAVSKYARTADKLDPLLAGQRR